MIYLDNASTTKIDTRVLDAMIPYMTEHYGNPGAVWYGLGNEAKTAVDVARGKVAEFLGCIPEQVVFTSGGTEGNNMVFLGLAERLRQAGKTHLIVSAIEHDSVLKAAENLTKLGFHLTKLPVNREGIVEIGELRNAIRPDTGLVSVMFVNNEIGSINPVKDIAKVCHENGALYHCDCVQAAGTIPFVIDEVGCDFATVSSHKIHGPKGVGAIYIRNRKSIDPVILGGLSQEQGMRGGTENVPGIVGFGRACEIEHQGRYEHQPYVSGLRMMFYKTLRDELQKLGSPGVSVNGHTLITFGKVVNIKIDGVDASTLLMVMHSAGVCMSAGSACNGSSNEPSHVLKGIGLTDDEARSSVRVSFSRMTTEEDARVAAEIMASRIASLRKYAAEVHT